MSAAEVLALLDEEIEYYTLCMAPRSRLSLASPEAIEVFRRQREAIVVLRERIARQLAREGRAA